MGLHENDPRDMGYIALCIAIKWYRELSAGAAFRLAEGSSIAKPGGKLTPELWEEIKKVMGSPNFSNINSIVKRFRVNKYEVFEMVGKEKNANEEVVIVSQVESSLKKLKNFAVNCTAVDCEKCSLNKIMCGETTLCEKLMDYDETQENRVLQETAINCSLSGEVKTRGFEIYKNVLDMFREYTQTHRDRKIRDIVSRALLEYMRRHGAK